MSIEVELERLRVEVEGRGSHAFVLTVADDGRPHVTATAVRWDEGDLVVRVGTRTAGNATARPAVSVLWPSAEPDGFSLIVDGAPVAVPEGGGPLRLRPSKAVLHRARPTAEGASASDCERVLPRR